MSRIQVSRGTLAQSVHADTGLERSGMDRHVAAPQDHEPPMWKAARKLEAEFGGLFGISGAYGFLRADWEATVISTAVHYEASGTPAEAEAHMREQLRRACVRAGIDPPALAGAPGASL